jgi:hypothetical protein
MVWIRHPSGEQTTIKNGQALGPESPLETDENGHAEVDEEERADLLATLDPNVETLSSPPETDDGPEEFDAESFVDRTPMSEVVEDLETGDYDDHLDEIEATADRVGVQDAIDERRDA